MNVTQTLARAKKVTGNGDAEFVHGLINEAIERAREDGGGTVDTAEVVSRVLDLAEGRGDFASLIIGALIISANAVVVLEHMGGQPPEVAEEPVTHPGGSLYGAYL